MKSKILYLTNLNNENPEEDLFLSEQLKDKFDVTLAHPKDWRKNLPGKDMVVIRNIWHVNQYREDIREMLSELQKKNIKSYNPLTAKGDMKGKSYLIELFHKKYSIIPTIDSFEDVPLLGKTDTYFAKPIDGESSIGIKKLSLKQLKKENLKNMIVQPFIDFKEEVSFYFIDSDLQYATFTPDKKNRWKMQVFTPSEKDIVFARKFIDWNALPYGIQRIDALRTRDGELLLNEVEDFCPFLSLLDIPEELRNSFVARFIESLQFALNQ